jgi:hypothetical protein
VIYRYLDVARLEKKEMENTKKEEITEEQKNKRISNQGR